MTVEEIQREIDYENEEAKAAAQAEFTLKTGEELRAQCHRLTEEVAQRYAAVMKGESPRAFGGYDRDEIARILNTDTYIYYNGYEIDTSLEPKSIDYWESGTIGVSLSCEAEEAWDRYVFIEAYSKFLHTAAAFAKSTGALHAMRLYLRAWGVVNIAFDPTPYDRELSADEALRIVNLERVATERLWVEVEAAKLPKFTPKREPKKHGKPKSSKSRRGRG